jgi:hypothetical protein
MLTARFFARAKRGRMAVGRVTAGILPRAKRGEECGAEPQPRSGVGFVPLDLVALRSEEGASAAQPRNPSASAKRGEINELSPALRSVGLERLVSYHRLCFLAPNKP